MIGVSEADISPPVVMLAATLVRMAHPTNENLHNALTKAESRIFTHAWEVSGGVLRIESESGVGTFRLTDGDRCDCPTKKYICWHRGAHFILSVLAAASIAPLKAASVPLVERGPMSPAAAADDAASLGNFLDRPEIAGYDEEEDVFFADDPALAALDRVVDKYADPIWTQARKEAESAYDRRYAASPAQYKKEYAYGAAYRAARGAGLQNESAHEVANDVMLAHAATLHTTPDTTSVVPSNETYNTPPPAADPGPALGAYAPYVAGRRTNMQDGELEKRRRVAEQPAPAAPVLWSTADYSEEENAEKIVPHVKERPFAVKTGGPPDPFEDVL